MRAQYNVDLKERRLKLKDPKYEDVSFSVLPFSVSMLLSRVFASNYGAVLWLLLRLTAFKSSLVQIDERCREVMISHETGQLAAADLDRYYKALDAVGVCHATSTFAPIRKLLLCRRSLTTTT